MTLRVLQEEHREAKLTLRPPSLAAPYAPVQSWQHQPEKLIFESCGYEANVSSLRLPASCFLPFLAWPGAPQTLPVPRVKEGLWVDLARKGKGGPPQPGWGMGMIRRRKHPIVVPYCLGRPC